jgi:transposase InsO family protein
MTGFCALQCPDARYVGGFRAWVIDAFSRRLVGSQFAGHMLTDLVLDALRMALSRRDSGADVELIHHSDAGSQPGLKPSSQRCPGAMNLPVTRDGCHASATTTCAG